MIHSKEGKRILETYSGKIQHKADKAGVSVNNLMNAEVPRDIVQHARKVDQQVSNWRQNHNKSRGSSVFIRVPWMQDKKIAIDTPPPPPPPADVKKDPNELK